MSPPPAAWSDLAVGLFIVLIGAVALWQASAIPVSPLYAQVGPSVVPYGVAALTLALGAGLVFVALRGGWSHGLDEVQTAPPVNRRATALMGAALLVNLALIEAFGFTIAATAQFVLVCAAFGSRKPLRDLAIGFALSLGAFFLFVEALGVNIGAGVVERAVLGALGRETP
ncbi:MAG TPA: tripartite tricarboxylate transporter TctB family protein [Acetobacteraceae bacterium]|nr:tripartite tricarboxylate transporter TctB family protein [Acetobacteraceae bacterium]